MRKIPTIFIRDWENNPKYVTQERNPECAWVFAGEGTPTRKYDGTCVRYDGERWWARREVKKDKQPPTNFAQVAVDEETGKTIGWEPIEQVGFHKYLTQALGSSVWAPGTYELCGPKVNGNPEGYDEHRLIPHAGAARIRPFDLTWAGIREVVQLYADNAGVEGIVWHHDDGRMAKIKARDFPGMSDITEFLNAQYNRIEKRERDTYRIDMPRDAQCPVCSQPVNGHRAFPDADGMTSLNPCRHTIPDVEFLERWGTSNPDPFVLADIESKRRILDEVAEEASILDMQVDGEFRVKQRDLAAEPYLGDKLLRLLAAPFSGEPGYKAEEWAV